MMPENVHPPCAITPDRDPGAGISARVPRWLLAALLGMVTLALYWPVTHYNFINYDDSDYVYGNTRVAQGLTPGNVAWAFSHTITGNWHPLTTMSHMLDCTLFGLRAGAHHLTSALFHSANTALVFLLLCRLTGAVWRSALVAAWFGWHPINVESVAWVAERKSVLSLFFGLLALWFYARHAQRAAATGALAPASRAGWDYGLAFLCLAMGLMSKSILVTWPFVMLLLDYWPLGRFGRTATRGLLWEKMPYLALVAAVSVATILTHRAEGDLHELNTLPPGARVENALVSYCRYLGKLVWPANLAFFYPHPGYWPATAVLLAALGLAGVTLLVVRGRRRHPYLMTGWLWFGGILVPVIGLMQVGNQAMADRHACIPCLGVFIMLAWGGGELAARWRGMTGALGAAGVAAALACVVVTRHQLAYWQGTEPLARHALAVTQNNFTAHSCLGIVLAGDGRIDEAIGEFQTALALRPGDATSHNGLAGALVKKNRTNDAIVQFREAIRLNPKYADAHFNLANVLLNAGQRADAIAEFRADLAVEPDDADAHYHLGTALLDLGEADAAIDEFQAAFRLKKYDATVHYNLANLLARKDHPAAAIAELQETIRLRPDDAAAHNNLGNLLAKTGQPAAAISELRAALRLAPNDADTHYNLGNVLLRNDGVRDAVTEFKAAVRLKADYAPAHYNLAVALDKTGEAAAAIGEFQEAIRLQPTYAIARNSLGIALAAQGRLDEAIGEFQAALKIKPDYAAAQSNLAKARSLKNQSVLPSHGESIKSGPP